MRDLIALVSRLIKTNRVCLEARMQQDINIHSIDRPEVRGWK